MGLNNISAVLIHTTDPGNIGAAARALKTMGLANLVLVNPKVYPHLKATARASGAGDLLAKASVCSSLQEAIADSELVLGLSARRRRIAWPQLDLRAAAQLVWAEAHSKKVALVFGQERIGLRNEELDRCHFLVQIAANPVYPSLNLAAAVQLAAYEIYQASLGDSVQTCNDAAPAQDLEHFFTHLEQTLIDIEFLNPGNPRKLIRRLRRLFMRARPETTELKILRGILTAVQGHRRVVD